MFDEFRLKYLTASSQTKAIAANYESALAAEARKITLRSPVLPLILKR